MSYRDFSAQRVPLLTTKKASIRVYIKTKHDSNLTNVKTKP